MKYFAMYNYRGALIALAVLGTSLLAATRSEGLIIKFESRSLFVVQDGANDDTTRCPEAFFSQIQNCLNRRDRALLEDEKEDDHHSNNEGDQNSNLINHFPPLFFDHCLGNNPYLSPELNHCNYSIIAKYDAPYQSNQHYSLWHKSHTPQQQYIHILQHADIYYPADLPPAIATKATNQEATCDNDSETSDTESDICESLTTSLEDDGNHYHFVFLNKDKSSICFQPDCRSKLLLNRDDGRIVVTYLLKPMDLLIGSSAESRTTGQCINEYPPRTASMSEIHKRISSEISADCFVEFRKLHLDIPLDLYRGHKHCGPNGPITLDVNDFNPYLDHSLLEITKVELPSGVQGDITSSVCEDSTNESGLKTFIRLGSAKTQVQSPSARVKLELSATFRPSGWQNWNVQVARACPVGLKERLYSGELSKLKPNEVAQFLGDQLNVPSRRGCSVRGSSRGWYPIRQFKVCKSNIITLPTARAHGGMYVSYKQVEITFNRSIKEVLVYAAPDSSSNICDNDHVPKQTTQFLKAQIQTNQMSFKLAGQLKGAKRLKLVITVDDQATSLSAADVRAIRAVFGYAIQQGPTHRSILPYQTTDFDNGIVNNSPSHLIPMTPRVLAERQGHQSGDGEHDTQRVVFTQTVRRLPWPVVSVSEGQMVTLVDASDLLTDPLSVLKDWTYTVDDKPVTDKFDTYCTTPGEDSWRSLMTTSSWNGSDESLNLKPVDECVNKDVLLLKLKDTEVHLEGYVSISLKATASQEIARPPVLKLDSVSMESKLSWSSVVDREDCKKLENTLNQANSDGEKKASLNIKQGMEVLEGLDSDCLFKVMATESVLSVRNVVNPTYKESAAAVVGLDVAGFFRPDEELVSKLLYTELWTISVHLVGTKPIDLSSGIDIIAITGDGFETLDLPFTMKPAIKKGASSITMEILFYMEDMVGQDIYWLQFRNSDNLLGVERASGGYYPLPEFRSLILPNPQYTKDLKSEVEYTLVRNDCGLNVPDRVKDFVKLRKENNAIQSIPSGCQLKYEAAWKQSNSLSNADIFSDIIKQRVFLIVNIAETITEKTNDNNLPSAIKRVIIPSPGAILDDQNPMNNVLQIRGQHIYTAQAGEIDLDTNIQELDPRMYHIHYMNHYMSHQIEFLSEETVIASQNPYLLIELERAPYFHLTPAAPKGFIQVDTVKTIQPASNNHSHPNNALQHVDLTSFREWQFFNANLHCTNKKTDRRQTYFIGQLDKLYPKYMTGEPPNCEKTVLGTTTKGFTAKTIPCEDGRELALQILRFQPPDSAGISSIAIHNAHLNCQPGAKGLLFSIPETELNLHQVDRTVLCSKEWHSLQLPLATSSNQNYIIGFDASKCEKDTFQTSVTAVLTSRPQKLPKRLPNQEPVQVFQISEVAKNEMIRSSSCKEIYLSSKQGSEISPHHVEEWLKCVLKFQTMPHGELWLRMKFTPTLKQMCIDNNYAVVRPPLFKLPEGLDATLEIDTVPKYWECSENAGRITLAELPAAAADKSCAVFSQNSAFDKSFNLRSIPVTDQTTLIYSLGSCQLTKVVERSTTATLKIRVRKTLQIQFLNGCAAAKSCMPLWPSSSAFHECIDHAGCGANVLGIFPIQAHANNGHYTIQVPDILQYGDFSIVGIYTGHASSEHCRAELITTSSSRTTSAPSDFFTLDDYPSDIIKAAHNPILKGLSRQTSAIDLRIVDPNCELPDPAVLQVVILESVQPAGTERHEIFVHTPPHTHWLHDIVYGLLGLSLIFLIVFTITFVVYIHWD